MANGNNVISKVPIGSWTRGMVL